MKKIINWGIMGPGGIAHKFIKGAQTVENSKIVAVGSRSIERAEAFAKQYEIPNIHGSYEALVNDPEVDIIYIATPHPMHKENALMCLRAGKAVLCEKPFTINANEASEIIQCARESKIFLMEAMWTRYLPAIAKLKELLSQNIIGEIKQLKADFCFRMDGNPESRLLNPSLGGGALLDVGVYVISFASMVFGTQPEKIVSLADIGPTGVDEQCSLLFRYAGGKIASLTAAVRTQSPNDVWIFGTQGHMHIPDFWRAESVDLCLYGKPDEKIVLPLGANGYEYEVAEAIRCLSEGLLESSAMSLDETLAIIKTMDLIRGQWGLRYPFE